MTEEFWLLVPTKEHYRYKVEADTIEDALDKHQHGESVLVPYEDDWSETLDPSEHWWIHMADGSEGNIEHPYTYVNGKWVRVGGSDGNT